MCNLLLNLHYLILLNLLLVQPQVLNSSHLIYHKNDFELVCLMPRLVFHLDHIFAQIRKIEQNFACIRYCRLLY